MWRLGSWGLGVIFHLELLWVQDQVREKVPWVQPCGEKVVLRSGRGLGGTQHALPLGSVKGVYIHL